MSGSIQSLENIGIVVDDLAAVKAFFVELGLEQVGETEVAGEWVDRVVGLEDVRCEICMLQTADGHGRLELMRFTSPVAREGDTNAPPNTLGIRRLAFSVDDIDAAVARLRDQKLELLGEVVSYGDSFRLCYVRGPEGIIVMLAERLGDGADDPPGRGSSRLLIVTGAAASDLEEVPFGARSLIDGAGEILVVAPALPSRLAWLASDTDRTREVADSRLSAVVEQLEDSGTPVEGTVGADDPLLAFEDAVADFHPQHILIALRTSDEAGWQERGLIEKVIERFGLPVTVFRIAS